MKPFFTIHKLPGVPRLALKLLHAVGIANGETFSHRFTAVYLLFIFIIAIPKLFCGYTSFEASVVGLAELFFQLNNFTGLLLVLVSSKQLQCLVRVGQTIADEVFQRAQADMRQLLTSHHKRMHKWTRYYCLVILYTVSIFAIAPICATFWSYVRAAHRNTTAQYVLHMEEDFYGLQIRSSLRDYLMFAIPMVPMSYVCAYVGCAKIMIVFNFTSYCTVYFRLVALQLQCQTRTVPSDRDSIRTIVTIHQQALCCADLLETIVSPIMLMQIVLCVLMSSSMILYFTFATMSGHMINVLLLFLVVSTETFGYCYLGTQLSMESARIAYAVYNGKWEQQPREIAKHLRLILLRAQKPIGITAGKFCYINMEQFAKLLKTTYSVFILLRDLL
uniref:Odorant receptor n=1 Tax=Anopheles merus TaxID=30066 RepID=A0A2Y9D320_ANOME